MLPGGRRVEAAIMAGVPLVPKKDDGRRPFMEATPAWLLLKPAKTGFFRLRMRWSLQEKADHREGSRFPFSCGQQPPLPLALAPYVHGFADLRKKTRNHDDLSSIHV